ncbi:MAG: OmpA family protein [Betaproteobacteria bacterium]|nr:MAG: OmpA family protein [Betaproteobacteria bacterium]
MRFMRILQVIALAVLASPAFAQSVANDGYARDASTVVVKNPFGLCWRSGQWSEGKAIAECDPEFAPKPAKAEAARPAAPIPEPAPVRARLQAITLGADASFDIGKADLKSDGQAKLGQLVAKLKDVNFDAITVIGHTDNVGTDAANQKLSLRRANAVKQYLATHGIDAAKIKTNGRGKTSPVADNKTAQGRARNRRVEVVITGTRSS